MLLMAGFAVAVFIGFGVYIAIVNGIFVDADRQGASAPTWELTAMLTGPVGWLGWLIARLVRPLQALLTTVFGAISLAAVLAAIIYLLMIGVGTIQPPPPERPAPAALSEG